MALSVSVGDAVLVVAATRSPVGRGRLALALLVVGVVCEGGGESRGGNTTVHVQLYYEMHIIHVL